MKIRVKLMNANSLEASAQCNRVIHIDLKFVWSTTVLGRQTRGFFREGWAGIGHRHINI